MITEGFLMLPPTRKQRKLERAVERLTVDGVPPTLGELAKELGVTDGAVRQLIAGLCVRGRARKVWHMPHTLELIKAPSA